MGLDHLTGKKISIKYWNILPCSSGYYFSGLANPNCYATGEINRQTQVILKTGPV